MSADAALAARQLRAARLRLRIRGARDFWGRFAARRDGLIGAVILVAFAILAIAPDLFVGQLQTVITASQTGLTAPNAKDLFGTDALGRDILNLTVWGTRVSLLIGLLATIVTVLIGTLIGIVAGYLGGWVDTVLMRITDFFLVLPTFVLALILAPIILELVGTDAQLFGIRATLVVIVVVIGITGWSSTARIVRSQAISVKERAFVDRSRAVGAGSGWIMRRHILPNVMTLVVANAVLTFAGSVLTETTLSFIGLGDPFQPSWGQVLNDAQTTGAPGLGAWWWILPPAVGIVLVVLAFTLLGNALDDVMNPRLRARR
jgi:peptide/nickel transport system permease protein